MKRCVGWCLAAVATLYMLAMLGWVGYALLHMEAWT